MTNGQTPHMVGHDTIEDLDAKMDRLVATDAAAHEKLVSERAQKWAMLGLLCISLLFNVAQWYTTTPVQGFVQVAQVDENQRIQFVGWPQRIEEYTPEEGQWRYMLQEFITHLRWRSPDMRMTQEAWKWLDLYTCGAGRQHLKMIFDQEKPFEPNALKVELDVKNIARTEAPAAFYVFWDELRIKGSEESQKVTQTATITVGRRKVNSHQMRLHNPYGLCVTGFSMGVPQS